LKANSRKVLGAQGRLATVSSQPVNPRADPASKVRGAISVIFGSKSRYRFTIVKEMKYTSQHCCDKTTDSSMALYREWFFPIGTKSWWM